MASKDAYALKFVSDNLDRIPNYKFEDLYRELIVSKFREEFDIFFDSTSHKEFANTTIGFRVPANFTYEQIVKAWEEFQGKNNMDDVAIKKNLTYPLGGLYNLGGGVLRDSFQYGLGHTPDLIFFLHYVLTGEFWVNYRECNDIATDHGVGNHPKSYTETFPELNNLKIQVFQNGKIKIKGLTAENIETIDYCFSVVGK